MRLATMTFLAFLLLPLPLAHAGHHEDREHTHPVTHVFEAADADADSALTPDEYAAAELGRFGLSFEDCDRDGDGLVTLGEYQALYDMHHPTEPEVSA